MIIFYHDGQLTQATAPSQLCIQNANSLDSAYKAMEFEIHGMWSAFSTYDDFYMGDYF